MAARSVCDVDYRLLWPGTLVVRFTSAGHRFYGVVQEYEHYAPGQKLFPVRFGSRWKMVTSLDVHERTDVAQPLDREPPPRTGPWAFRSAPEPTPLPIQRWTSPALEQPIVVIAAS
jgi:hypothetical protein